MQPLSAFVTHIVIYAMYVKDELDNKKHYCTTFSKHLVKCVFSTFATLTNEHVLVCWLFTGYVLYWKIMGSFEHILIWLSLTVYIGMNLSRLRESC